MDSIIVIGTGAVKSSATLDDAIDRRYLIFLDKDFFLDATPNTKSRAMMSYGVRMNDPFSKDKCNVAPVLLKTTEEEWLPFYLVKATN